jgi:hypothetical protein
MKTRVQWVVGKDERDALYGATDLGSAAKAQEQAEYLNRNLGTSFKVFRVTSHAEEVEQAA